MEAVIKMLALDAALVSAHQPPFQQRSGVRPFFSTAATAML